MVVRIFEEFFVTGFGLYGVDVYVDESDGERAKRIVEEVVAEEDEEVG